MITAQQAKSLMPEPKEFQEDCRRIDQLIVEAATAGENSVTYHLTGLHHTRIRKYYLDKGYAANVLFYPRQPYGMIVVSWTG